MTKEEVQLTAFQIISIAGDAMDDFYQGMNAYLEGINLAAAVVAMKRGQERMAEVHNIQTKLIQAEVNEEEVPYSGHDPCAGSSCQCDLVESDVSAAD